MPALTTYAKEQSALQLFQNHKALVKVMMSSQGADYRWKDHLKQLAKPSSYRPRHHARSDVAPSERYNPATGGVDWRSVSGKTSKNTTYIPKTDTTLARPDGRSLYYAGPSGTRDNFSVALIYDLDYVDQTKLQAHKYFFDQMMGTDSRPWLKPNDDKKTYWGRDKTVRSKTLAEIRAFNDADEWKINSLSVCPSKAAVKAVAAKFDFQVDRLNALHKKYLVKKNLGLDVPVLVLPHQVVNKKSNDQLRVYDALEQYTDLHEIMHRESSCKSTVAGRAFYAEIDIEDVRAKVKEILRDKTITISEARLSALAEVMIADKDSELLQVLFDARQSEMPSFNTMVDGGRMSHLHVAIYNNDKQVAKSLITHQLHLNLRDVDHRTPPQQAIRDKQDYFIDLLLAQAEHFDDNQCRDVLKQLLESNQINRAKKLLTANSSFKVDGINLANDETRTPLTYAIKQNDKKLFQLLIAHGAEVNEVSNHQSTIEFAVETNHKSFASLVLSEQSSLIQAATTPAPLGDAAYPRLNATTKSDLQEFLLKLQVALDVKIKQGTNSQGLIRIASDLSKYKYWIEQKQEFCPIGKIEYLRSLALSRQTGPRHSLWFRRNSVFGSGRHENVDTFYSKLLTTDFTKSDERQSLLDFVTQNEMVHGASNTRSYAS